MPETRRSFLTQALAVAATIRVVGSPMLLVSQEMSASSADPIGKMKWLNEPAAAKVSDGVISLRSRGKTDFWRETYTGTTSDNGHFFRLPVSGDFVFTARVNGAFADPFDQAGLMVRLDAKNWMKCGIEFFNGKRCASVVFTRDFSDWSVMDNLSQTEPVWWRAERKGNAIQVYCSPDGKSFSMIRSGYFVPTPAVEVGVMCAAPEGNGFEARFDNLSLRA